MAEQYNFDDEFPELGIDPFPGVELVPHQAEFPSALDERMQVPEGRLSAQDTEQPGYDYDPSPRRNIFNIIHSRRLQKIATNTGVAAVFLFFANHGFAWSDSDARNAQVSFVDWTELPNPLVTPYHDFKNIARIIP